MGHVVVNIAGRFLLYIVRSEAAKQSLRPCVLLY